MNRLLLVTMIAGLLVASAAIAQQHKADDGLPPVQAPPAMDDPNNPPTAPAPPPANSKVKTVPLANSDAEAKAAADAAAARKISSTPTSSLVPQEADNETKFDSPGLPPEVQKAAEATELPVVTVRQDGYETIEEYRKKGKLFAQRIIPKDGGPSKWYIDKSYKGPIPAPPRNGPGGVEPVEYKLFEW